MHELEVSLAEAEVLVVVDYLEAVKGHIQAEEDLEVLKFSYRVFIFNVSVFIYPHDLLPIFPTPHIQLMSMEEGGEDSKTKGKNSLVIM